MLTETQERAAKRRDVTSSDCQRVTASLSGCITEEPPEVKEHKSSTRKLLQLIKTFSKVAGYTISTKINSLLIYK